MKKVGIIIQARMGSTRLSGKILRPFYKNLTILEILLATLHKIEGVKIIVATSINKENDVLEDFLKYRGELVFRGSENDVLKRFIDAAEHYSINKIIRICSDNPFIDIEDIQKLIEMGLSSNCDYMGFDVNGKPSILTHFGFWGEYVTLEALKKVYYETEINTPAHEHVTNYIYNHPELFKCGWIKCPEYLEHRTDIRLTVDTPSDFENAQTVYSDLQNFSKKISLKEIVDYVDNHPALSCSMQTNINNNNK